MLETLWPQLTFCMELLRFTSKYWVVCLFCVQVIVITYFICNLEFTRIQPLLCPTFYEDLIHLKFSSHKRSSIFACLVSIQRMRILSWLIMSIICFLLVRWFLSLAFTLCFRIASSSPPIFLNFKKSSPSFWKLFLFLKLNYFHNKLGLRSMHFQNLFINKLQSF